MGKGTEHLEAPLKAEVARLMEYPIVKGMFPEIKAEVVVDRIHPKTGEPSSYMVQGPDGSIIAEGFTSKEMATKHIDKLQKDLPVHVQDTMGTKAIKTGPNQYESGVKGLYAPEGMGPRERIYLSEGPVRGEFGTDFTNRTGSWDVTPAIEDVLAHEVAHPIFERLQKEWTEGNPNAVKVDRKIQQLSEEWQPSEYAKTNPNEWLSETFARFIHPEFAQKGKMPPKVQEFMKRMVNAAKLSDIDTIGLSVLLQAGGAAIVYELLFGDKESKEKLAGLALMVGGLKTIKHPQQSLGKSLEISVNPSKTEIFKYLNNTLKEQNINGWSKHPAYSTQGGLRYIVDSKTGDIYFAPSDAVTHDMIAESNGVTDVSIRGFVRSTKELEALLKDQYIKDATKGKFGDKSKPLELLNQGDTK